MLIIKRLIIRSILSLFLSQLVVQSFVHSKNWGNPSNWTMLSLNIDRARCLTDRAVWIEIVIWMLVIMASDNPSINLVSTKNLIPNTKLLFLNPLMKITKRSIRIKPKKLWEWWTTTRSHSKNFVSVIKPIIKRVWAQQKLLNLMNNLVTTNLVKRKENPSGRNSWRKSPMVSLLCFGLVLLFVSWSISCKLMILPTYIWVSSSS